VGIAPHLQERRKETPMTTLRNLYLAALAIVAISAPIAAYTGYYAPVCGYASVWTFSGYTYEYVCN
jgi:hypothetical protein